MSCVKIVYTRRLGSEYNDFPQRVETKNGVDNMSMPKPISMRTGNVPKEAYARREKSENALKGTRPISAEPPETLSAEGKEIYSIILANLSPEILNQTDGYTIEVAADAIANMRECRRDILENGLFTTYVNASGARNRDQSKAVLVYQKYSEIYKKYIPELGLSPAARSRIANLASIDAVPQEKKTIMDLLNEDEGED